MSKLKNKRTYFLTVIAILTLCVSSQASIAASGGASGTGKINSAIPMDAKDLTIGIFGNMFPGAYLGVRNSDGKEYSDMAPISRVDGAFAMAYGFTSFFETGLYVPLFWDANPQQDSDGGVGDVKLSMKFNYPPTKHKKGFELSLLAQAEIPVGKRVDYGYARHSWSSQAGTSDVDSPYMGTPWTSLDGCVIAKMLTTANFGVIEGMFPLLLHLNWGMAFSGESRQNALLLAGGLEVIPVEWLSMFWSFDVDIPVSGAAKHVPVFSYPIASTAGVEFNFPVGLGVLLGIDFTINQREEISYRIGGDTYDRTPNLGFFGELSYDFSFAPVKKDTLEATPVAPEVPVDSMVQPVVKQAPAQSVAPTAKPVLVQPVAPVPAQPVAQQAPVQPVAKPVAPALAKPVAAPTTKEATIK